MDLNVPLKDGSYPLHHAAQSLSSGLTELFIRHGANADVRCNDVGTKFYGLLPLNVAVESICHRIEWTPKQSTFRLHFTLCNSNLNESLHTICMLSVRTSEVNDVLYHYAKEGKLIHFASLLMVTSLYGVRPNEDGRYFDGSMSLRRLVAFEIVSIDREYMLLGSRSRKQAQLLKEKKRVLSSMMVLLEVFQRIGCRIKPFIMFCDKDYFGLHCCAKVVARHLKTAGFKLADEDFSYFISDDFYEYPSDLGECRAEQNELHLPSYSQAHIRFNRKPTTSMMQFEQQRSIWTCSLREKPGLSSLVLPFHTSQSFKVSIGSELCRTMEAQVKKASQAIEQHVPNIMTIKKWSSFALALKKGLRHI
uniref:Uncharacterized protein n=1 Tax=Davidia involucrata TaxID=16924 RepID=A0A5B7AWL0_DAVIN